MALSIRKANKLSAADLAVFVDDALVAKDLKFRVGVTTSADLTSAEKSDIWRIFELNMRDVYVKSSFGWDPPAKRRELFHQHSRFILVRDLVDSTNPGATLPAVGGASVLAAYTMFRFEREEGESVLYCYELQVARERQGFGLGKHLMNQLSEIARRCGMDKVMLTVQKENAAALAFYERVGFTLDPTSPDYNAGSSPGSEDWIDEDEGESGDECDYQILSKQVS